MAYPLNEKDSATKALIGVKLSGDIIVPEWFNHIGRMSKLRKSTELVFKPDLLAIVIYANIVFWYRPIEIRSDNEDAMYMKKYKADTLQKSYGVYKEKWGVSREQARNAIELLEELNLVKKEVKNKRWVYLELNIDRFFEITFPGNDGLNYRTSNTNDGLNYRTSPSDDRLNYPTTESKEKLDKDIKSKSPTDFTAPPVETSDTVKKQPTPHQQMIVALATVMNIDPDVVNIWKRFGTFAKTLVPKYTAQQVEQWYGNGGWYWLYHWKGKKGEYPNQSDIQGSIKTASEYKEEKLDKSIIDLQQHFEQLTGFTRPVDLSQQTRQEWVQPCETLLEKANGNAKEVMTDALRVARDKGYTYKSPNSLLTIALNIIDGHSTNEGPASILEGV